jgi:anti-sigma factor RsiW
VHDDDHATEEQLSALLDSQLPEPEAASILAHLEGCELCRTDLERLRATVTLLQSLPVVASPRPFGLSGWPERRTGSPVSNRRPSLLRLPEWLASPVALRALAGAAAALTVVLFIADAALQPVTSPRSAPVSLSAPAPTANDSASGQAAARAEPRAAAPPAGVPAAGGAQTSATPGADTAARSFSQPPAETSGRNGVVPPSPAGQPAGPADAAARWLTPSRAIGIGLAAVAACLLVMSSFVRRVAR